jgi:molybdopterin-guanine dinucleotide biosynthesis protein MobB
MIGSAKALAICGPKKCGKTSLICRLVAELSQRQLRVAVMKHAPHLHVLDVPATDTDRFRLAGAAATLLVTPGGWALHTYEKPPLESLWQYLGWADLVLLEGFGSSPLPKLVLRPSLDPSYAASLDPATVLGILDDPGRLPPGLFPDARLRLTPEAVDVLLHWIITDFLAR